MKTEDLVRASYEAFNTRDYDALKSLYAPDCVLEVGHLDAWPGQTRYEGHDQLVAFIEDWWGAWESMTTKPAEIVEGDDSIYVLCHLKGVARGGVELDWEISQVATLTPDGLVSCVSHYSDHEEARRAAGV